MGSGCSSDSIKKQIYLKDIKDIKIHSKHVGYEAFRNKNKDKFLYIYDDYAAVESCFSKYGESCVYFWEQDAFKLAYIGVAENIDRVEFYRKSLFSVPRIDIRTDYSKVALVFYPKGVLNDKKKSIH